MIRISCACSEYGRYNRVETRKRVEKTRAADYAADQSFQVIKTKQMAKLHRVFALQVLFLSSPFPAIRLFLFLLLHFNIGLKNNELLKKRNVKGTYIYASR